MGFIWDSNGIKMGFIWDSNGITWGSYGIHLGLYGIYMELYYMELTWDSYGIKWEVYIYIHINIHIPAHIYFQVHMMVDQNSFIRKRPFFANKNVTFAKLSRTPPLSFAGPMLGNNASCEDSFTTCQIAPLAWIMGLEDSFPWNMGDFQGQTVHLPGGK